jgi:MFS family permease
MPSRAPTAADLEDQARFHKLASESLADVRAAAEKWRTGLAALITLITGGLLIKGPESANDLTTGWRIAITILGGGGIAVAILGLWSALKASAGLPKKQEFDVVVADYGSVLGFEVAQADKAAGELHWARRALLLALPLLGAALICWWWAPTKPTAPPAYVEVDRSSTSNPVCGTLVSGDNGHLRVQVAGEENPTTIDYPDVTNIRLKASC